MNNTQKLKLLWTWYFTQSTLAGIGFSLSLIGIIIGAVTGNNITLLLLTFIVSTLLCTYSLFKWLETDKQLIKVLKKKRRKR